MCCGVRENKWSARNPTVNTMTRLVAGCSDRKSQRANRFYPERREDHAADTPAVVRHRESGGAGADEPGRDDRVECKRAHPTPARAAEHARHRELPGRRRAGPTEAASG